MRKLIIAIGSLMFTMVAPAQEALQCVNPDVLNSLLFNARAESKLVVRRGMPDVVAGFRAPAEFTLIGSGVRGQNLSTVVAYKTTADSSKAFDSLLAALSAEGWKREPIPQPQMAIPNAAPPSPFAAALCRDGERRNMLVQEIGGVRYATIFGFKTAVARACGAPPAQQQGFQVNPMAGIEAARANLPQFSFPETTRMAEDARDGGSMGSGSGVSTAVRISSPDTATNLLAHLARQLSGQGWRADAEWKGKLGVGSTWVRNAADGKPYWGTLEILNLGSSTYEVGFSVSGR